VNFRLTNKNSSRKILLAGLISGSMEKNLKNDVQRDENLDQVVPNVYEA